MGREGLRMGIFGTYRQQFSTEHQEATLVEMKKGKINVTDILCCMSYCAHGSCNIWKKESGLIIT